MKGVLCIEADKSLVVRRRCTIFAATWRGGVYIDNLLGPNSPLLVNTSMQRFGLDVSAHGHRQSLAFAGITDDTTFNGKHRLAFADNADGPAILVTSFPNKRTPGDVLSTGDNIL